MATAASIQAVQEAYIAYYGRPGDPAGIDFWAERLDAVGGDTSAMISAFGTSAEATARYASLSVTDAVNAIYNQIFGRDAEAGASGIDFYVNKVLSGEFSLVTLAQNIYDGATGSDLPIVAAKYSAASAFTQYLRDDSAANAAYVGNNAAGNARNWLANVQDEASATSQTAAIATTIATISEAPSNPGSTFTLTSAATDAFTLTDRDDTVTGTRNGHLQTGDRISDASSDDADVLNAVVNSSTTLPAPTIDRIETLNITGDVMDTGIDLSVVTGANTVNLDTAFATSNSRGNVSNLSTLATDSVVFSADIKQFAVSTSATGTRDTPLVSILGSGASGTLTGGAGSDSVSFGLSTGTTINIDATDLNDSGDRLTISNQGAQTLTLNGASTLSSLVVNASGSLTLNIVGSDGIASGATVNGTGPVTLNFMTSLGVLTGTRDVINSEDTTINVTMTGGGFTTGPGAGNTLSLSKINADLVNFNPATGITAASASTTVLLHADSTLRLSTDLGTAITIGVGSGANVTGINSSETLSLQLAGNQSALLGFSIHDSVSTLMLSAVSGHTTTQTSGVSVNRLNLESAFSVLSITGDQRVAIGSIVSQDSSAGASSLFIDSSTLTERLTLNNFGVDTSVTASPSSVSVVLELGDGGNYVSASDSAAGLFVSGGDGSDTITGGSSGDTISGGDGDDRIFGRNGNNVLQGGEGNDTLTSGTGTDSILGGAGNDSINGGTGNDTLRGGDGNDTVVGDTGVNLLFGDAGDDVIASSGTDTVTGGEGADTFRLSVGTAISTNITDFEVGTDRIQLVGSFANLAEVTAALPSSAGANVLDLNDIAVTVSSGDGTFEFGQGFFTKIDGVTSGNFSSSVQLGRAESTGSFLTMPANVTASIVGGLSHDYVELSISTGFSAHQTLSLGQGADTVLVNIGAAGNGTATAPILWADFAPGTDKLILAGSHMSSSAFSVGAIQYDKDTGQLGDAALDSLFGNVGGLFLDLGSGLSTTSLINLSSSVQLGYSGSIVGSVAGSAGSTPFVLGSAAGAGATVTGGLFGDIISMTTAGQIFSVGSTVSGYKSDGSGSGNVDFIGGSALGVIKVDVTGLAGMTDGASPIAKAANAAKAAAVGGEVYVFANAADGAGNSLLNYSGRASLNSATFDDVATFLDAQLTVADGQKFVAVINDISGTSAYAYYVDVSGSDVSADDLTLISLFAFNGITASNLQ